MAICYVGRCKCGSIVAAVVGEGDKKQIAKDVAEFIEEGLTIEQADTEDDIGIQSCKCKEKGIIKKPVKRARIAMKEEAKMEKIDVRDNKDTFIGHLLLEVLGKISDELRDKIAERDKNGRCKPIRVELKFNGHIVPFKSFMERLEKYYSDVVKQTAKGMMKNMIPEKLTQIRNRLDGLESYCDKLVNMVDWD